MPVSLVQVTSSASVSVLVFPSAVTAGNLLVVASGASGIVGNISDNFGNTWIQDGSLSSFANNLTVWHTVANASGTCTVTVSTSASPRSIALVEFTGIATISEDDDGIQYGSTTPNNFSVFTNTASTLIVAFVGGFYATNTFTATNGTLITQANGSAAIAGSYLLTSTVGNISMGFNIAGGGADNSPLIIIAYKYTVPTGKLASSKTNAYAIASTPNAAVAKTNVYVVATTGVLVSKTNAYAIPSFTTIVSKVNAYTVVANVPVPGAAQAAVSIQQ